VVAPAVSRPPHASPRVARAVRIGQILAAAGVAAFVLHASGAVGADQHGLFDDWIYNGLLVLAAVGCVGRAVAVRHERRAWLLMGLGIAAWTVGDLHYAFFLADADDPPFPSIGDAFYLAFYPAGFAALLLLLRSRLSGHMRTLSLDGATASLAAAAVGAGVLFTLVTATTGGGAAVILTNLAYPLGDLLLLALVVGVFALTGWRPGTAWTLIGAGMIAATIADGVYLIQVAGGTYVEGGVSDAFWPAAMLLLALAAWRPTGLPGRPLVLEGRLALITPVVCALIGVGVQVYDHFDRTNLLALALSVATIVAVVVRLDVTFLEKRRLTERLRDQATTDPVTGTGNRRKLMADLEDLLRHLDGRTALLMIFDLDGFKRYNDTFGHPAGDALLGRLGRRLATAVEPFGSVYRLGGDEFCLLAELPESEASALIDAAAAALCDHGDAFEVTSSFGAVFLRSEADSPSEALRLADQRLYAEKARRSSERGLPQDVLLRVLFEREPDLHEHVRRVARLAEATGRLLGVTGAELEHLRLAAELHDIGKLAIPDELLMKPAPLDEEEWAFVRKHTLIGQRILTASPALVGIGRIVRSTHERWDGAGYPDGLRGEDIPLAARIINAADAYVAMTDSRPYTSGTTPELAARELRRCAGAQFDPAVVEGICAAAAQIVEPAAV
jgi:two-component system cell cycle response regulator